MTLTYLQSLLGRYTSCTVFTWPGRDCPVLLLGLIITKGAR